MPTRTYKGYSRSENGWPIVDNAEIDKRKLLGLNNVSMECLRGDVSDVMQAWLYWYHRNVEPIDIYQPRDEWFFSWDNAVPNSNHLSGTAGDVNATQWPWQTYRMPKWMVDKINEGLRLFEDNIFHGRNWSRPDEMHFQINGYNPQRLAAFAQKLRDGYLGIFKPADPNAFPLPLGYAFGPLTGPEWQISGEFAGDPPAYREALGRWQSEAGIPVTKKWDDRTAAAVKELQEERGWWFDTNRFKGLIGVGEWNAVISENWGPDEEPQITIPDFPPAPTDTDIAGVYYADVSQYQVPVNDSYPHKVLCIRSNTGSKRDTKFDQNYEWGLKALREGKIKALIVYYFFRPGQANCDLWREMVSRDGKIPNGVVCMVDVEGDKGSVSGNVSAEVNDEVGRVRGWIGDPRRVIGYYNRIADPTLWPTLPDRNFRMVVPRYNNNVADSPNFPGLLAHQYTDRGACVPFGTCDMNFSNLRLSQFLVAVGLAEVAETPTGIAPTKKTWADVAQLLEGAMA